MKKPLVLMILDGFGLNPENRGNAIAAAKTPNLDALWQRWPHGSIAASGLDVGLPRGQMGNSEVGHTNIGAGRVVYQELTRITKAVEEGSLSQIPELMAAVENCRSQHSALHLLGLLSDGGVHSHIEHLFGLLKLAKDQGLEKVYVHCFMDGRDVPPSSGRDYVLRLQAELERLGLGRIATLSGRYYAMDRDNRWERVQLAYEAMVLGRGVQNPDPAAAMAASYGEGVTDEFVKPVVVDPEGTIKPNDSVSFFNFRPDRARELTRSLVEPDFSGFEREKGCFPLHFVCMTQYDATMPNVQVAFHPQSLEDTLGQVLSKAGLRQLRIAETEKYAHVTFFFNGGVETVYPGEERCLIHSPKVATYDLQPEMSAYLVTDALLERLGQEDVVILNYANCDMVGHTGVFDAAVKAVEAVDACVGRVAQRVLELGGQILLTADHGNADQMLAEDGSPFTAHSCNPVPLLAIGVEGATIREGGRLADLAPTMLELLGLPKPAAMSGQSLLQK